MNVLSYRTSELNGLSFDLLIDGESVQEIFESDTVGVPYWLVGLLHKAEQTVGAKRLKFQRAQIL